MSTTINALLCDLCRLPVRNAVSSSISGDAKTFCCHGCSNVYHILIESESLKPGDDPRESPIYLQAQSLGLLSGDNQQDSTQTPLSDVKFESEHSSIDDMRQVVLEIEGMWCSSCAWLIRHGITRMRGVISTEVSFASDTARVTYKPAKVGQDDLIAAVNTLGYHATALGEADSKDPRVQRRRRELTRAGLALFAAMNVMMLQIVEYAGYKGSFFPWLLFALTIPVLAFSAPIFTRAFKAAQFGHATMDTLVSIGATSAFLYSTEQVVTGGNHLYFDTASMLLGLVMVGKFLESGVRAGAVDALTTLYGLLPRKASIVSGNTEKPAAIDRLQVGDIYRVRPGERIPADGEVIGGTAGVDESLLTGESTPAPKAPGAQVTGGSVVLDGTLDVRVSRLGNESTLSKMIGMVETAMATKTPAEQWADRISRVFVPFILLLGAGTVVGMALTHHSLSDTLMRAVSVLVIACPCALGIATPMAMSAGVGAAAQKGVLITDGAAFERLGRLKTLFLDKTGTLTEGRFGVRAITGDPDSFAALFALETLSEHLIARAIVRHFTVTGEKVTDTVTNFKTHPGLGVTGTFQGAEWFAGNARLAQQCGVAIGDQLMDDAANHEVLARTVIFWGKVGGESIGIVALGDEPRTGAREAVSSLAKRGIDCRLVSGDSEATVRAVADQVGLVKWSAALSPEAKAALIVDASKQLPSTSLVGMIGDGINDAPALASAGVGFAMASGTELASQAAQITLLNGDLRRIPELLDLAAQTTAVMRQNLFWACLYNAVCIPLAICGVVQPLVAALAMMISSASVILNTRRLKWVIEVR